MQVNSFNPNFSTQNKYSSGISFKNITINEKKITEHVPDALDSLNKANGQLQKLCKKYLVYITGHPRILNISVFGLKNFQKDVFGIRGISSEFTEKKIIESTKEAIAEYNKLSGNQSNGLLYKFKNFFVSRN